VGDPPNVIIATNPVVIAQGIDFLVFTLHMLFVCNKREQSETNALRDGLRNLCVSCILNGKTSAPFGPGTYSQPCCAAQNLRY